MAPRDPQKTRRNKEIAKLTERLNDLTPSVLSKTGLSNKQSLNGKYGGKYAEFIDIKNQIIYTLEQFVSLYLQGFQKKLEELGYSAQPGNAYDSFKRVRDHEDVKEWLILFLKRTYLKNYEALSKQRPTIEEAEMWIGQENASYGLLVTPRFKNGQWENDKSEIRHFKPNYWTIGHILETGFVVPHEEETINFNDINQYLTFFKNTLVRNSGSSHEMEIVKRYCDYVKKTNCPNETPLLIPEFRYGGISKKHKYRLDFTIIDHTNMCKIGFEISPWSTHGQLRKIKAKTQKKVNDEALENFEKEMKKLKNYFRRYGITVLVYTDSDLKDYDEIFEEIKKYLNPKNTPVQLEFQAIENFLSFEPS